MAVRQIEFDKPYTLKIPDDYIFDDEDDGDYKEEALKTCQGQQVIISDKFGWHQKNNFYYAKLLSGPQKGNVVLIDSCWLIGVGNASGKVPCNCPWNKIALNGCKDPTHE